MFSVQSCAGCQGDSVYSMRDLLVRAVHLLVTAVKLLRPGGVRAVAADSVLLKHQLRVSNRSRQRAPNLTSFDRIVLGLATLFVNPPPHLQDRRDPQAGHASQVPQGLGRTEVPPAVLVLGASPQTGPKGPSLELITAIVEIKRRNPRFGHLRVAQQISRAFGVDIDKDVITRVG